MNRFFLTAVAGGLLVMASCSQEEITKQKPVINESFPITFRAGMSTRVNPELDYTSNPSTFYVTGFKNNHKAVDDSIPEAFFTDEPFYQMGANVYASTSNVRWPEDVNKVEFFAYAPSLQEIYDAAITQLDPTASNYSMLLGNYHEAIKFFNLCKDSVPLDPMQQEVNTFDGITLHKGFKLGRFYVATDISKQVDFITAHINPEIPKSEDQSKIGTELEFKHQLSNIELRAFSGNPDYNIEVAGVRIGRAYTGGAIFNFCDNAGNEYNIEGGQWGISKNPQRLPMEYIYGEGDEIYRMGSFNNLINGQVISSPTSVKSEDAKSIMGKGGNAMVIPTKNGAWAGLGNPWIAPKYSAFIGSGEDPFPGKDPKPWSPDDTEGEGKGDMYFSILIRVTLKPQPNVMTTTQIYPYGNNTTMNTVCFEKDKHSNKIIKRVDSKSAIPGPNNEIVEFGWAAVPVGVDWERGKKYIYTLDFTNGVGIQDPEDPNPGTPIIGSGIKFTVSVSQWIENSSNNPQVPSE